MVSPYMPGRESGREENMDRKKWVDILGNIVILGFFVGCFLKTSIVLSLSYYLLLFAVSYVRVRMFYKIPKSERRVYDWMGLSWKNTLILHPVSQMGCVIFMIFAISVILILALVEGRPVLIVENIGTIL